MRKALVVTAVVGWVLAAPIALVPSYDFPPRQPFRGDRWRNPYEGWQGTFRKVNLHAHSAAWGGLTQGDASPEAMARRYAEFGFEALAISNYHQATHVEGAPLSMVRAYEHGLNVTKSHRLVLGPSRVVAFDFPVSTRSMRQWMLDLLGARSTLVGLSHPSLRGGHDCADVERLTGFQLFEVHNPYATSLLEWDCALSAGRLAWAVGNDDSHSTREEGIGIAWNMVAARDASEGSLLEALAQGRSYVVRGERGRMDVQVELFHVDEQNDTVRLRLDGFARIEWVVDGAVARVEEGVRFSEFPLPRQGHYVRAVVRTPLTEIVLNPIVRTGFGDAPPVATVNWPKTVGGWVLWLLAGLGLARVSLRRRPSLRLVPRDDRAA